ncbi:MAG: penicillin-binding protein 1A, partial [Candidatus Margulisiibacteriota bacterium]
MGNSNKIKGLIIAFLIVIAVISGLVVQIIVQLPNVEEISNYNPSESTVLYASDNNVLARLHKEENRRVVPLSKISPILQQAVVAIEDERFYKHAGVDFFGIGRAFTKNLLRGRIVQGASTITQQLARNIFLTHQKTLTRKLAEAFLAFQIERRFSKEEILELYLNQIYFGHNCYGVESASQLYFDKHADELTLGEATMLAGLIEGPELFSPYKNQTLALRQQRIVLQKMIDLRMINKETAVEAAQTPIKLYPNNIKRLGNMAPYFISDLMKDLVDKYGEEVVYKGGLKVTTTIDPNMQAAAERVVENFMAAEGKKYNFSQIALVAIDPRTGQIKAMVGGADFKESQFNHATQAKRPPGSSFKPFVYTAAVNRGMSPGTILSDRPTTFKVTPNRWNPQGTWKPMNFDRKFHGNVTMRTALERSYNLPAIKTLEMVGINAVINMAHRMGIESDIEPAMAIALGVSDVTLLEMTSAYGVLATGGMRTPPVSIIKVVDRNKKTIFEDKSEGKRVLDENTAAVMVDMMKGVLTRGTGVQGQIGRPAAAKTGTSQDMKDAWFIGFTPQLVAGVWVGNDDNRPMQRVAEVSVCPRIWKEFMKVAMQNYPVEDFVRPAGLVPVRICLSSGMVANEYCPSDKVATEYFFKKDAPISNCYIHPKERPDV